VAHVQYFYGYHEPFVGKVTSYDLVDQYYTVQYVDDDDVEENDEFELSQMVLRDKNSDDQDGASKYLSWSSNNIDLQINNRHCHQNRNN
jgi:hypothetical protein